MNESDAYVYDEIRKWVWSGFYSQDEIQEMLEDILEDDCDEAMLRASVASQWQAKQQAEQTWPTQTDCDRLDALFEQLHASGICALANAGYTMSDGHVEVNQAVADTPDRRYHGYCFYHGQDMERAIDGGGLMLAFGDLEGREEADLAVGQQVAAALRAAGFTVDWDGTPRKRIDLPGFVWQRRADWE
ncbi:hypothetical protein [uncultured Xanthomonas sp.]|uniref:DUF6891 domain-containing protein n=1 Tax=uncultured Xanthomonas sp. TaxID=152831 RepID=UPI0025ECA420|nr:hypothetical protein [uncultured Xanthomonas sp.]